MKYFLSPAKQVTLIADLMALDMTREDAKSFAEVPDDLHTVDLEMDVHIQCVIHFRQLKAPAETAKGLLCLAAFMAEAEARGLSETDFPLSHQAIQANIADHNTIQ